MGQIYPTPTSAGQSLAINTNSPLTGGGVVLLGGSLTLGLSTTNDATRKAYVVSPDPDGTAQNFTIVGAPTTMNISYADVFIDGKIQLSSVFSLQKNILSLNTAPSSGSKIRVVFSYPSDNRQQFTLVSSSPTVFTFPTTPESTYVDVYDGNGNFQSVGSSGYYLNIVNGEYSVVFASAPVTPITAVFDPSTDSGRQSYPMAPVTGSTVNYTISGGAPSTNYIDIFAGGLFQMDGSSYDYTLSYTSGNWTVSFSSPPSGSLEAVFAPSSVLPSVQTGGNTVNQITAGTNISISPTTGTGNVTINASGGAGTITGVTAGTGLTGGGTSGTVTLGIGNTGVSAGSYTNTNLTVNAQGQITSASNGSGGSSVLRGSASVSSISGTGWKSQTVSVSGATVGAAVAASIYSYFTENVENLNAEVTSAGTVTVYFYWIDPGGTYIIPTVQVAVFN